jgi:serine/threonine protein kinase
MSRSERPPRGSARGHRLLLELGRGGMGTVYLALADGPAGFHKLKVVKRLRPDLGADPQFLAMFLDEARLSARLNHSNIVQTFEIGFDGIHYFIEMEYLEGQTYDAVIRRAAPAGGVPLPLALWVLHQVLEGLGYAHELRDSSGAPLGVVHRDVSPHNLLVTYDGTVKLLDFGIAKAADSSADTRTGVVKGKATYMAPEQAVRQKVDRRADLFAVGVMLWQALTGKRLWGDARDSEIFEKLRVGDIPAPHTVEPGVDPDLEAICLKAIAHRPEDRYANAGELQSAIEGWLERSGARVGNRAIGKFVGDLFADSRRAVQAEIDAQMNEVETRVPPAGAGVPVLGHVQEGSPTKSGDLSASRTTPHAGGKGGGRPSALDGPVETRRTKRARRSMVLAVGALALLCMVVGARLSLLPDAGVATGGPPSPRAPTACTHDRECALADGVCQGGTCVARASVECTRNRECTARRGTPAVCRRSSHTCASVESEDCRVLAEPGDVDDDSVVWFGTMFPTRGAHAATDWQPNENAVDLARRDFVEMLRGVSQGRVRRFAVVACDDSRDYGAAADHLMEAGVPAVIGFGGDVELVDLATSRFSANGVLALSAANTTAVLSDLATAGEQRLVWRTAISVAQWGQPMAAIIAGQFEPHLRQTGVLGPGESMRIALVRGADASSLAFTDSLLSHLEFNGRPAAQNEQRLRQVVATSSSSAADARALVEFAPHLVVVFDTWNVVVPMIRAVERDWPTRERFRPVYFSPWMLASEALFDFIGASPVRRRQFFGLATPANTPTNAKFVLRYNETFADKTTLVSSPSTAYDAAYLLAYAANAIAPNDEVTGVELARQLARFGSGTTIEVGPGQVAAGLRAAQAGDPLHLVGSTSDLAFDARQGEIQADEVVMCVNVDGQGRAFDGRESGLRWDVRARALVGRFDCW